MLVSAYSEWKEKLVDKESLSVINKMETSDEYRADAGLVFREALQSFSETSYAGYSKK